ncbi:MAG: ion channel [Actinomycetota bacterium]|jgi:hypothetical protein
MKLRTTSIGPDVELGEQKHYLQLFVAVVSLFVLQASLPQTPFSLLIEVVVASAALMLAVLLAELSRRIVMVVGAVVALVIAVAVIQTMFGGVTDSAKGLGLVNLLLLAAGTPALIRATSRHSTINASTILGAITIYVLIGLFFAAVYRSLLIFNPDSFLASSGSLTPSAMQYLSFVTLTTVGFGDITPVTNVARTTVALEALIGQVYLVTVVAVVVGRLGHERGSKSGT